MSVLLPPPAIDPSEALKRRLQHEAGLITMNNYLKVCCAGLLLLSGLLGAGWLNAQQRLGLVKPFVVGIRSDGQAEQLHPEGVVYKPSEQVLKHFLLTFTTNHYSRLRATMQRDFPTSLYFLDGPLARAAFEMVQRTKTVDKLLAGETEEIDVKVANIAVEEMPGPVYRAVVDYQKIYLRERHETRRERYLGHFTFVMKQEVPVSLTPANPLGLVITNLSENRAFEEGK